MANNPSPMRKTKTKNVDLDIAVHKELTFFKYNNEYKTCSDAVKSLLARGKSHLPPENDNGKEQYITRHNNKTMA